MSMDISQFQKIKEASYLTADQNTTRYRIILRFFYIEHERMKDLLYPAEILKFVRSVKGMEDYTEAMLEQDLQTLVNWNNIIPRQEMKEPKSIEDYKRKRFRYQITPYTVEFERMLVELEKKGDDFGGALEKSAFVRLLKAIRTLSEPVREGEQEQFERWEEVLHHFKQIKRNTSDYIGYLNSDKLEANMQTKAFLVYKDQFVNYLRDFVMALQQTALKIQSVLTDTSDTVLQAVCRSVISHKQSIPRIGGPDLDTDAVAEDFYETWKNIKSWFINNESGESEYASLQRQTNEAIRRITRMIQRFGERLQQHRSRKKDYLQIAKWFDECSSLEEAHQLSATVFGMFHTQHYAVEPSETSDVYADLWEEKPSEYQITPRVQGYREKTRPSAFTMNDEAKKKARQEYLERMRRLKKSLYAYVEDGKITLSHHPFIDQDVRKVLLRWVARAQMQEKNRVQTEFGIRVSVDVDPKKRAVIHSEDGTMEMPDMIYTIEE
ncbi:TIGR02677 family protein [Sporolactobacillus sp. THM7-4]|nr:TIGR02677 family protein [Sporolactobacillus sp. THM7-4]